MKIINVFIGSSSKFIYNEKTEGTRTPKDKLKSVIQKIEEEIDNKSWNVKINPWWKYFKEAGTLLGSFSMILQENDIGIFVMGKDVNPNENRIKKKSKHATIRNNQKDSFLPNMNVIAEFGMFNAIGKTTFIIMEGNHIKLPSDMNGINSVTLERPDEVVTGFLQTLEYYMKSSHPSGESEYEKICTYYDASLSNRITTLYEGYRKSFKQWETKALYVGSKSANIWKNVENDDNYTEYLVVRDFVQNHENEIKHLPIQNVISFGPGAGKVDSELMNYLEDTYYIPIDLNVSLAIKSAKAVTDIPGCHVPFAVIDDFELPSFYRNIGKLIEARKKEIGKYNLFSFLGVTFSNLSMTCDRFFTYMKRLMKDDNDYLLIDAIIYDKEKDEDLVENVKKQIDKYYQELLVNSINKKGLTVQIEGQQNLSTILEVNTINNDKNNQEYIKRVSIPNTKLVCVKYQDIILLIAKYYKFEEIEKYISKYFDIEIKEPIKNRGVFLLKKQRNSSKKFIKQ